MKIIPTILAGGSGTRLWPLSRRSLPKQFLRLPQGAEKTLFQQAVARVRGEGFAAPVVLGSNVHRFLIAEQLQELGLEPGKQARIVLEPLARNTAPAALIAALLAREDDIVLLMPSDHHIPDSDAFNAAVQRGVAAAEQGDIVVFGIQPTAPETGYGYIAVKSNSEDAEEVLQVERFTEKPSREVAQAWLEASRYYWNAGIFLFRAGVMHEAFARLHPKTFQACRQALEKARQDLDFLRLDADAYARCENISVDYAIMERVDNIACVPLNTAWSDLGSWEAVHQSVTPNGDGNVIVGDVLALETVNSLLWQGEDGPMLAVVGLQDVVAVTTRDAVLLAARDRCQHVREVVEHLRQQNRSEAEEHVRIYRPWGWYEQIASGERFQVKCLMIKPGARLSLQSHHHRAEHWVVVHGTVRVTCDEKEFLLTENESTYIPIGARHRLENPGKLPAMLIEVQSGAYLGEDDIVRYEDLYGRVDDEEDKS